MARLNWLLVAGLLAVSISGCSGKTRALYAKASADLKCGEDQIEKENQGTAYIEKMSGCGKELIYVHTGNDWESPVERAAFELSCSKEQLAVTLIDAQTVGVSGCGQKVVYVAAKAGLDWKWVLNSSSGEAPNKDAKSSADAKATAGAEK